MAESASSQKSLLDYSVNQQVIEHIPEYKKLFGFNHEVNAYAKILDAGLGKYLIKHNPLNSYTEWKKTVQKGADFVFKIGKKIIAVDASFFSKPYKYRTYWFVGSRYPRFREYSHNPKAILVWLVSNPESIRNLEEIKKFAADRFNVLIMSVTELIQLVTTIANTITVNYPIDNNTLYSNSSNIDSDNYFSVQSTINRAKKLGLFYDFNR